jgi:hypothetical protein
VLYRLFNGIRKEFNKQMVFKIQRKHADQYLGTQTVNLAGRSYVNFLTESSSGSSNPQNSSSATCPSFWLLTLLYSALRIKNSEENVFRFLPPKLLIQLKHH